MTDALELFRSMRPDTPGPPPLALSGSVPTAGGDRDLHQLAMVPGSAAYRARIPRPPCYQCGEDHYPMREYSHDWTPEPPPIHDEPVSAAAISRRPPVIEQQVEATAARRVALYVGRNDTYVIAIEEAPDWDNLESFRVTADQVLPMITMARALRAKVVDKTGGDLLMLEQEDVRQHAQAHERSAAAARGAEPRRPGPAADRSQESQPEPPEAENGSVSGRGSKRRPATRPTEC
jgi:hypothetical protein